MPSQITPAALFLPAAALILAGCWGGDSDSGGLVDTYTPAYTEPKGTVHDGDFFPLNPGEIFGFTETMTTEGQMSIRASGQGQTFSQDTTMSETAVSTSTVETKASTSRTFAAGTFTVFPMVTTATVDEDGFETEETSTDFVEKTDTAINIRATLDVDGIITERSKPTHLKLPLRVGDSWEGALEEVPASAETGTTMEMQVKARTFVVGMETVVLGGKSYQAMRLDQVAEMSSSGVEEGVTINMQGEVTMAIYLVAGVGQVGQRLKGRIKVSGSGQEDGVSVKLNMTMDMEGDGYRSADVLPGPSAKLGTPVAAAAVPGRESLAPSHRVPAGFTPASKVATSTRNAALGMARSLMRASSH